jgi:hypothetical protein
MNPAKSVKERRTADWYSIHPRVIINSTLVAKDRKNRKKQVILTFLAQDFQCWRGQAPLANQ